ncbi:ATP-binding protein [Calditerrivibrio nitroreducens]
MNAIKKHISVRFDISVKDLKLEELARKDIWEYPLEALREAVINALIHRDYLDTAPIRIKIYEDKITIWNLGKLMPPLTVEMLKQEHSGYHRNRFITAVFYYAGLIEKCVSGTIRIIQLCKEQGLPEPEFMETPIGIGAFPITFNKDIYTEEQLRKLELNERQIKAEMYVNGKGKITNKEYREISNLKERFATIVLNNLVNKGILVKYGTTGRGTYYAVAKTQKPHKTRSKDADKDNNVD